ncbi:hypothetical protein SDC9_176597 [bioreactor metagenome]|uniref:Uncharacterized protein n=1 Tax=bioreactor metagenome TaxID=1076179 RepID=A0A645GSF6_9ZZZZ
MVDNAVHVANEALLASQDIHVFPLLFLLEPFSSFLLNSTKKRIPRFINGHKKRNFDLHKQKTAHSGGF